MKEIVFVMLLAFPGGQMPPVEESMPDLQTCLERVQQATADFEKIDESFRFVAACHIMSKKLDPA